MALIFEGSPFREEAPGAARLCLVVAAGTLAVGLYWGLKALGNGIETWDQYPVELWVGGTALLHIAGAAILHQAVWAAGRWLRRRHPPPPRPDRGERGVEPLADPTGLRADRHEEDGIKRVPLRAEHDRDAGHVAWGMADRVLGERAFETARHPVRSIVITASKGTLKGF